MKNKLAALICLSLVTFVATGCGSKADTSKPVAEIQKEVETMNQAQLEKKAKAYANAIMDQTKEIDKVKAQLKDLSPKDLLSEKAKSIKDDLSKVTKEVSELTKRYDVYAKKFKELGGDLSKIDVKK